MSQYNSFNNPIGVDISDFKIRFFQLHRTGKKEPGIQSFGETTLPKGLIVDGLIKNEMQVIELIKKMFANPLYDKPNSKYINVSLPEKRIYIKTILIPNVPDNEISGAVKWGIEQNIPVTLDQVYYDWHIFEAVPKKEKGKIKILVSVAPKEIVDTHTRIIKQVGYLPIGFENESVAMARCLINQKDTLKESVLILDLGKSRTNFIIYHGNAVQYSSTLDITGETMTKIISQSLKLSFDDAEKAKIICGLDSKKGRGSIKKILEPIMQKLVSTVQEQIKYYDSYIAGDEKNQIILLTGSASKMVGLPTYLESNLKLKTFVGNPATNITYKSTKGLQSSHKNKFFSYTTAIGLALKSF